MMRNNNLTTLGLCGLAGLAFMLAFPNFVSADQYIPTGGDARNVSSGVVLERRSGTTGNTAVPVDANNPLNVTGTVSAKGGYGSVSVTPTVQAAAYSIGNTVGGLLTFTNIVPNASNGGMLQGVTVKFASGIVPSTDLVVFNANPTGSTITDKTAITVVTADIGKVIGVLHISDCTLLAASTESVCQAMNGGMLFNASVPQTLYGALVTRTAVTLGSTTDATIELKVIQ